MSDSAFADYGATAVALITAARTDPGAFDVLGDDIDALTRDDLIRLIGVLTGFAATFATFIDPEGALITELGRQIATELP